MTYYPIRPAEWNTFQVGETILPMYECVRNVRLVRCRREGDGEICGWIEGDPAWVLRDKYPDPPKLLVVSVSEVSGWCQAVVEGEEMQADSPVLVQSLMP